AGRDRAAADALAARPDALVVVGADARDMQARLAPFGERKIPVLGWHVGPHPGAMPGSPVAMNVTTDPLQVARVTALAAVGGLCPLAAGDGASAECLGRPGKVSRAASVAEPLALHGWQRVDEANRLLSGAPVSGYIGPVHLSTLQNIAFDGGARNQYDPDNGY